MLKQRVEVPEWETEMRTGDKGFDKDEPTRRQRLSAHTVSIDEDRDKHGWFVVIIVEFRGWRTQIAAFLTVEIVDAVTLEAEDAPEAGPTTFRTDTCKGEQLPVDHRIKTPHITTTFCTSHTVGEDIFAAQVLDEAIIRDTQAPLKTTIVPQSKIKEQQIVNRTAGTIATADDLHRDIQDPKPGRKTVPKILAVLRVSNKNLTIAAINLTRIVGHLRLHGDDLMLGDRSRAPGILFKTSLQKLRKMLEELGIHP